MKKRKIEAPKVRRQYHRRVVEQTLEDVIGPSVELTVNYPNGNGSNGHDIAVTKVQRKGALLWLILGIICAVVALGATVVYARTINMTVALVALPSWILAAACGFQWMHVPENNVQMHPGEKPKGKINALVIWAKKDDSGKVHTEKVEFTVLPKEQLIGPQRKFVDLKQWLHVMINDPDNHDKLKPFELPDVTYESPKRLVIPLTMRAYKKWMTPEPSMFQKIGAWVMVAANALALVGIIVAAGA